MIKKIFRTKEFFLFLAIILVAIFLRILVLKRVFFVDELFWVMATNEKYLGIFPVFHSIYGTNFLTHPPLGALFYIISASLLGLKTISFRIVPFVFGILTIVFTYLIAKALYDKKTGLIAMGMMSLSFWHIVASTQIDLDGSILTFFFIMCLYFVVLYEQKKQRKWQYLAGLCIAFAMLTKYVTFLLIIIIIIYFLLRTKSIKKSFNACFLIFLIGFLIFLIFPIFSFLMNKELFMITIRHGSGNLSRFFSTKPIIDLLLWATPFLLVPAFLSIFNPKKSRSNNLLLNIWIGVVFLVYLFFLGPVKGPFERYLMILIPPLCILGASVISKLKLKKSHFFIGIIVLIFILLGLFFINTMPARYLVHNTDSYISEMMHLRWNFNFPYTGSSGPDFWVNFLSVGVIMVVCAILLIVTMFLAMTKNKAYSTFLIILISTGFAFNLMLTGEYLFNITHPNIDKISKEIISFSRANNLQQNLYLNPYHQALSYYINKKDAYLKKPVLDDANVDEIEKDLETNGGAIMIIDFPTTDKTSKSWHLAKNCTLLKTFEDKNVVLGYAFSCDNLKK